jgi:DNA-binding transcriptional regulator YiaG
LVTSRQALGLAEVRRLAESGEARRIREDHRLSLAEAGGAVGVSAEAIRKWELGTRRPSGRSALAYLRLLKALGA